MKKKEGKIKPKITTSAGIELLTSYSPFLLDGPMKFQNTK
jgi:hypothetical protein